MKWNSPTGRGIKNRRSKKDIALHGTKIYQTDWKNPFHHDWSKRENDHAERGASDSDKWTSAYGNEHGTTMDIEIDVCEREQCIDNDGADWAAEFFFGELICASWFIVEVLLRLFTVRSFFRSCANLFDVLTVLISLGEAVCIPIILGGMLYEVWGNPIGDPSIMRAFRLLVTIRFITMQRRFSGIKVISLTVKKVAGKMKIPLFFFFVFAVIFASFFYIIESGELFIDCQIGDYLPPNELIEINACVDNTPSSTRADCVNLYNNNWGVCRSCPQPSKALSASTNYNQEFKYNGTCSNFVIVQGENGLRLGEPKIRDMLDAIWTMIVTMTTVGYGGFFPLQSQGKIVALIAALFGSFYMAMPLTIVGSKFYEIYEDVEVEDYMLREEMKKIFKAKDKKNEKEAGKRLSLSLAFNLKFMNKMKKYSTAAKIRVREMSLDPIEIDRAFEYMDAVDGLPQNHDFKDLKEFAKHHFKMIKLMAKHLVHRKKTITYVGDGKEDKEDEKDKTKVVPIDTSEMPPIDKNNGFIPPTLLEDVVVTKEEEVVEEVVEVEESVERQEEEGLGLQTLDV